MKRTVQILVFFVLLFPLAYLCINGKDTPPAGEALQPAMLPEEIPVLERLVAGQASLENLLALSEAYIRNNMPGKSIDLLEKAILLDPSSSRAFNDLAVAHILLEQYQSGIDASLQALRIDSGSVQAKNSLTWATTEKNKVLEAIAMQEKVEEKDRDIELELARGHNYFKIGAYDKSIEVWNRMAEKYPKDMRAYNNIGTAFMMKRQVDDAIFMFKKVLEAEPDNPLAKNNLAWAMAEKGR